MPENGWIKLHRKLLKTSFYKRSSVVHLFVHLLLTASQQPQTFLWNNEEVKLQPGQLITGREELSAQSGITQWKIRNGLYILKSTSTITIKSTNRFSLITILKWDDYQIKPASISSSIPSNKPPTNRQQTATYKNIKKEENNKNNTTSSITLKKQRSSDVDLILSLYSKYMEHLPTDRKPRFVAYHLAQALHKMVDQLKNTEFKGDFEDVSKRAFIWYTNRDEMKGETLDVVYRKIKNLLIPATLKKYDKS